MMMKPLHFGFLITPVDIRGKNLKDDMERSLYKHARPEGTPFVDIWSPSRDAGTPTPEQRVTEDRLVGRLMLAQTPFLYRPSKVGTGGLEDDVLTKLVFDRMPSEDAVGH